MRIIDTYQRGGATLELIEVDGTTRVERVAEPAVASGTPAPATAVAGVEPERRGPGRPPKAAR